MGFEDGGLKMSRRREKLGKTAKFWGSIGDFQGLLFSRTIKVGFSQFSSNFPHFLTVFSMNFTMKSEVFHTFLPPVFLQVLLAVLTSFCH
jgi:hypothetical protein